jgi:hypothetical protein
MERVARFPGIPAERARRRACRVRCARGGPGREAGPLPERGAARGSGRRPVPGGGYSRRGTPAPGSPRTAGLPRSGRSCGPCRPGRGCAGRPPRRAFRWRTGPRSRCRGRGGAAGSPGGGRCAAVPRRCRRAALSRPGGQGGRGLRKDLRGDRPGVEERVVLGGGRRARLPGERGRSEPASGPPRMMEPYRRSCPGRACSAAATAWRALGGAGRPCPRWCRRSRAEGLFLTYLLTCFSILIWGESPDCAHDLLPKIEYSWA